MDNRDMVYGLRQKVRHRVHKSLLRDRANEHRVQALSKYLWPWQESWLMPLIALVAILDYTSTYILLDLSGKANVYEAGLLASWALRTGGFGVLLLVDVAAITGLLAIAIAARYICLKYGFKGYARAMFVALLVPYAIAAFAATTNNLTLTFL